MSVNAIIGPKGNLNYDKIQEQSNTKKNLAKAGIASGGLLCTLSAYNVGKDMAKNVKTPWLTFAYGVLGALGIAIGAIKMSQANPEIKKIDNVA